MNYNTEIYFSRALPKQIEEKEEGKRSFHDFKRANVNSGCYLHLRNTFAFFSPGEQEVGERSRALGQHNHPTPSVVGMWFLLKHFYPPPPSFPTPPIGTNMSPLWLNADC